MGKNAHIMKSPTKTTVFSAVVKFNITLDFKRLKAKNYTSHYAMSHKL